MMTSTRAHESRYLVRLLLLSAALAMTAACSTLLAPRPDTLSRGAGRDGPLPAVVLLEPVGDHRQPQPLYRPIRSTALLRRLRGFSHNESARIARRLHRLAWRLVDGGAAEHPFFIAVVKGGNHAAVGFRIQRPTGIEVHAHTPYVKLGPRRDRFRTTLLHETGHVVLGILAGRRGVPAEALASLPHSTAMLTDRGTAFSEGFAVHLETLQAHFTTEADLRSYYHRRLRRGRVRLFDLPLLHPVRDIATYAQNFARYVDVRDNAFSFASAHRGGDYFRVQLDRARDYRELRSADQLLASEGFVATYFFHLAAGRLGGPRAQGLEAAYAPIFGGLMRMLRSSPKSPRRPYLADFVSSYVSSQAGLGRRALELFFDLSHGVFFLDDAIARWRSLYDAALRVRPRAFRRAAIALAERRNELVRRCLERATCWGKRLGAVIPVEVTGAFVDLPKVLRGGRVALRFDLNTVQPGVLRLVPGLSPEAIRRTKAARDNRPFRDRADFLVRSAVPADVHARLRFL